MTKHIMRKIRIRSSERGLETTFYKSDGTVETKTSKPELLEFVDTFIHVFMLFFAVNVYDMLVLDWAIFCHSKKAIFNAFLL